MKLIYTLIAVMALNTNGCKSQEKVTTDTENAVVEQKTVADTAEAATDKKETTMTSGASATRDIQESNTTITYLAATRGYREEVKIANGNAYVNNNIRGKEDKRTTKLEEDITKQLQKMIADLDLKNIKNLKSPSKNHHVDAALAATITITKGKESYTTPYFDANNPPKEIAGLVRTIQKYK